MKRWTKKRWTSKGSTWTGGALIGAGLMYLLDPERGRRRRGMIRDKTLHALGAGQDAIATTSRDLRNRARGLAAEARKRFSAQEAPDEVLAERVRARIGRVVSHPRSIEVTVRGGTVTLAGPVLAHEIDDLLSSVSAVRGVRSVESRLETHKQAGDVPGLQGGVGRPSHRFELFQTNWSPTARVLAGTAGAGMTYYGVKRRDALGAGLATVGAGILARGLSNMELKRLLGLGASRRGFDVHKTVRIDAPVETVYPFWANVENFPRFLSHVREVRDHGQGRSHWKVSGPAGVPVEWDAVLTQAVPNRLLAWKSMPGEAVRHSGVVHFEETQDGATRIDIRLTYKPPAGALGHAVAALFGSDPKRALDEDMVRLKSLLEHGKTTAHGQPVRLD